MRVVRYRWPKSLDGLLAAAIIAQRSHEDGIAVQCEGTNALLTEDAVGDANRMDELYLLDYGCLLDVPYLTYCCNRYRAVHVYDHYDGARQVPVRDNLSIHNVMDVATCAWVARDFGMVLSATQQSLFAYVEDSLVLHTRRLPFEEEFRRGAEAWMHATHIASPHLPLSLEPATLIESGKRALQQDKDLVARLWDGAKSFGRPTPCGRLVEIADGTAHSALPSLVTALLYDDPNKAAGPPLLVAIWMNRDTIPYVLLRALQNEEAQQQLWETLGLARETITLECGEWEQIKRRQLFLYMRAAALERLPGILHLGRARFALTA